MVERKAAAILPLRQGRQRGVRLDMPAEPPPVTIYEAINRLAADPDTVKDAAILWLIHQLSEARKRLIAVEIALRHGGEEPR